MKRLPTLFIPHGGGPCFFMDWGPPFPPDMWDDMAAFLRSVPEAVGVRPRAVLVISGHWETPRPSVIAVDRNTLLYDYHGFPDHTYHLSYPAPGAPDLAQRIVELMGDAGIYCQTETLRGLDHGVFIPLLLVYPDAEIPVTQLSLPIGASAEDLLAIGRALAPLRDENILILGSGMTYHNIAGILGRIPGQQAVAAGFDEWLGDALTQPDIALRDMLLSHWMEAPFARQSHPSPEHLLPLLVVAGAGGHDAAERIYNAPTFGNIQSAFRFGEPV